MANLRVDKITSTETFETTGSVQFRGASDYFRIADSNNYKLGNSDFTIEGWFYFENSGSSGTAFWGKGGNADKSYQFSYSKSSGKYTFGYTTDGSTEVLLTSDALSADINTWVHFAAVRNGSSLKVYRNGTEIINGLIGTNSFYNSSSDLFIGLLQYNTGFNYKGHISNFRFVKGKALYTENFTPTTKELTVTPETVLLCCQHKTDTTHEKTGKTITVNGSPVANELTPGLLTDVVKSGGNSAITGSVEFDGTGDYLSVTPTDDFELGSDDFTIEAWVYSSNWKASLANTIFSKGNSSSVSTEFYSLQATQTAGRVQFFWRSGSALLDGSNTRNLSTDSWNHVAVTRSGDTFNLYINGILDDTTTSSTTLDTGVSGGVLIGGQSFDPTNNNRLLTGNISNLRIVKGTALYTDNFIPPTRELKKVPGTVLLCCQDSNDPTTEATGKTITGYGDLQKADGVELVSNGHFTTDTTGWTAQNAVISVSSGQLTVDDSADAGTYSSANQDVTTEKGKIYLLKVDIVSTTGTPSIAVYHDGWSASSGNVFYSTYSTTGTKYAFFTNNSSTTSTISIQTSGTTSTVYDNVSVTLAETRNGASNFTPQVGNDDSVEFVGPTKINTENYFYLPTGDTVTRDSRSGRGLFSLSSGPSAALNTINYIQISSSGNLFDFGDLSYAGHQGTAVSSSTRGIFNNGNNPGDANYSSTNILDYVTIATTGNSVDFGDLTTFRYGSAPLSNSTRGVFVGGLNEYDSPYPTGSATRSYTNTIDYISMATLGNAIDFGDSISSASSHNSATCSSTRGVYTISFNGSANDNSLYYITIATTGNGQDFGNLSYTNGNRQHRGVVSNGTRGIFAGALVGPAASSNIDHITISSLGDGQDFGDLTLARRTIGGTSNSVRGVFAGGYDAPPGPSGRVNLIDHITIASTGNAKDFGDLIEKVHENVGCSDSHGGLG